MLVPLGRNEFIDVIRKSKFITHIAHAEDVASARKFIEEIKCLHQRASHNCWAYKIGTTGDETKVCASDDGEPAGSAGKPILNALMHSDICEVVVVVTRYFGGIKFGTGPLARTYASVTASALSNIDCVQKIDGRVFLMEVLYKDLKQFKYIMGQMNGVVIDESYSENVIIEVKIANENVDEFLKICHDYVMNVVFK